MPDEPGVSPTDVYGGLFWPRALGCEDTTQSVGRPAPGLCWTAPHSFWLIPHMYAGASTVVVGARVAVRRVRGAAD